IGGMRVVVVDGGGVSPGGVLNFTVPDGTRLPHDGFYVIADRPTLGGASFVPNGDAFPLNIGMPDDAGAVRLFDGPVRQDVVAWGAAFGEGASARDVSSAAQSYSLARSARSTDTDNNRTDFSSDPTPSPGLQNNPVAVQLLSLAPAAGPASGGTRLVITARDVGFFTAVSGTPEAGAPLVTIGERPTEGCTLLSVDTVDLGRVTFACTAASRTGATRTLPEGGLFDVVIANTPPLGGAQTFPAAFESRDGNANETNRPEELDFCDVVTTAVAGRIVVGDTLGVRTLVAEAGVTTTSPAPAPGLRAEIAVVRVVDAQALPDPAFVLFDAAAPLTDGGTADRDAWGLDVTGLAAGYYRVLARASVDQGRNWTLCDADGAGSDAGLAFDLGGLPLIEVGCVATGDCAAGERCVEGRCELRPLLCVDDTNCNDGTFCNGPERCAPDDGAADERGCLPSLGPPSPDIEDNDPCNLLVCDEARERFVFAPDQDGPPCSAELFCVPTGQCDAGAGVGPILPPDDGDNCTVPLCNGSGFIETRNPDDASVCTVDSCAPDGTIVNAPIPVDDGNACTLDVCDRVAGVSHPPVDFDDDNVCTTDSCDPVTGVANTPIDLDDANPCTVDTCDPVTGVARAPVNVDDADACTTDSCDPATGIVHVAVDFDDDNLCTADRCDPVTGVANTPINLNDDDACTIDACDPATGISRTPVVLDDNVACTVDTCDRALGVAHRPDHLQCAPGQRCDVDAGCTASAELGPVIVTEFRVTGGVPGRFVELRNTSAAVVNVAELVLRSATAAFTLGARAEGGATALAGGATALAVFSNDAPTDATLLLTAVSGTTQGSTLGAGPWALQTAAGQVNDLVPAFSLTGNADGSVGPTDIPVDATGVASTQVDVFQRSLAGSNSPLNWCVTFRLADTRGVLNQACRATVVINEVLVDFNHVSEGPFDEGREFVELAGPPGASLANLRVVHEDAAGRALTGVLNTLIPAGRRMPLDGVFVVADGDVDGGATLVPGADVVVGDFKLTDDNGSLRLRDGVTTLDRVAWGVAPETPDVSAAEGSVPAFVVAGTTQSFSLARDVNARDTDDNLVDFDADPSPSPGARNAPIDLRLLALDPGFGPAQGGTTVRLTIADAATLESVNGVSAALTTTIRFGGVTATCRVTDVLDGGRGPSAFECTTPSRIGLALEGDVVDVEAKNDNLIPDTGTLEGGSDVRVQAFRFEDGFFPDALAPVPAAKLDFCNIQFPTDDVLLATGQPVQFFSQVFEAGRTDTSAAPAADLEAQFGFFRISNVDGSDPVPLLTPHQLTFIPANPNPGFDFDQNNNDEFFVTFRSQVPGRYRVGFRYRLDGGLNWTMCDEDGAGANTGLSFDIDKLGVVTVQP
ncbi:MAG: hypothetical protein FJ137_21460, partial [Deltaproteobacteria bacterium]|nr:hypothetical protein [Deltaproteobacteria bacterium]